VLNKRAKAKSKSIQTMPPSTEAECHGADASHLPGTLNVLLNVQQNKTQETQPWGIGI
jgi:hypothetical protein